MSDTNYVLDASVVLASLFEEHGAEALDPILSASCIGTVNLCEVVTKLQERGIPDDQIERDIEAFGLQVVPFDFDHALRAGKLRALTRTLGLSLGDRACLALAAAEDATAVTMDRSWAKLDLPIPILVARK